MPLQPIDIDCDLSRLSILDAEGHVDEDLAPDLGDERLRELYRTMLLSRRLDERMLRLQRGGEIGTFAPVKGQEASQVGAAAAIQPTDWLVPSFRESAAAVWRGASLARLFLYNAGYNEGGRVDQEARDLPLAIPVASQLPHAVGIAYGARYLDTDEIVLTFFGDGATSEGDFHESLNFAAVFGLPIVFLCQNNQWAISVPRKRQTKSKTLAQKATAYGMPGVVVDGNDVLAVYEATARAAERARHGDGPTLIECETYRLEVHTTADDPDRYRDREEVREWEARDPLIRTRKLLVARDILSEADHESLEQEIDEQITSAWNDAKEQMRKLDDPLGMFDNVYAEIPKYLERQRADCEARIERPEGGRG